MTLRATHSHLRRIIGDSAEMRVCHPICGKCVCATLNWRRRRALTTRQQESASAGPVLYDTQNTRVSRTAWQIVAP